MFEYVMPEVSHGTAVLVIVLLLCTAVLLTVLLYVTTFDTSG